MKVTKEISKQRIISQLIELAPQVNGDSRMRIAAAVGISFPTITRYFSGKVSNMPTAKAILEEAKKIAA